MIFRGFEVEHHPRDPFPFAYRPICSAVVWTTMIEWCAEHLAADAVIADQTWLRFKNRTDAERFAAAPWPTLDGQPEDKRRFW